MVAGQSQHGVDAKGGSGQHIAHDGHTVTVTTGHLHDGVDTGLLQLDAQAQRRSLQTSGLHIGNIDSVNLALEQFGHFQLLGKVAALGGCHLSGDGELAGSQLFLQNAHFFTSRVLILRG